MTAPRDRYLRVRLTAGKRWRATGGTTLSCFTYLGTAGWVAECYGDVVDRMGAGLYDDATERAGAAR